MKCEHKWELQEAKDFEWCGLCGTLRFKVRNRIWYKYPKNLKRKKDVVKYRKDISAAEKAWYKEWSS